MVSQRVGLNMLSDITEIQFVASAVAAAQSTIQIADDASLPSALATVNSNIAKKSLKLKRNQYHRINNK